MLNLIFALPKRTKMTFHYFRLFLTGECQQTSKNKLEPKNWELSSNCRPFCWAVFVDTLALTQRCYQIWIIIWLQMFVKTAHNEGGYNLMNQFQKMLNSHVIFPCTTTTKPLKDWSQCQPISLSSQDWCQFFPSPTSVWIQVDFCTASSFMNKTWSRRLLISDWHSRFHEFFQQKFKTLKKFHERERGHFCVFGARARPNYAYITW